MVSKELSLNIQIDYLIGVDGGGSGTRAILADTSGVILGTGTAGRSGLAHGVEPAWRAVRAAIDSAFNDAAIVAPPLARLALGLGLAGVHNKQWAAAFAQSDPGFGAFALETDAYTTLLGAHGGLPGAIIATGTGSVGEALAADGSRREVGGWGFPSSDEASGAWLGLHAVNYLQRVLDGRDAESDFSHALIAHCGGDRDGVFTWLGRANQTTYAQLAPLVTEFAKDDPVARGIMCDAAHELAKIAVALDPAGHLPIALCGGLAVPLRPYLPADLLRRVVDPRADAASGALLLIRTRLQGTP